MDLTEQLPPFQRILIFGDSSMRSTLSGVQTMAGDGATSSWWSVPQRSISQASLQVLPELRPTRFKSDYERAAMNAVKKVYPGITCEGDSFHFV